MLEKELENMEFELLWDDIYNNFNFHKVKRVMDFLEWTWGLSNMSPSIKQMEESAYRLCKSAYESNGEYSLCASGGFIAIYEPKSKSLRLMFSVEDWDTEDEQ